MDELTLTLRTPGQAPVVRTLTCDPVGGDHPHGERACTVLAALGDPFAPTPPGTITTMIYGGPATVAVEGHWRGQPVHAVFDRTNGAEIARWDRLGPVLDLRDGLH
ncbi:MAG: SSI family serine proteinase inhibitor [bacterium]